MKIISFIYERKVIKKILDHLGIFQQREQKRGPPPSPKRCPERVIEPYDRGPPPSPKRCPERVIEPYDNGCPEYEESWSIYDSQSIWIEWVFSCL